MLDKFYRDWEPSQDEMIGLIAGLCIVHRLMPGPYADTAQQLLAKIADYLTEYSYFMVRPGGGFVNRGPAAASVAMEYAYNVCFTSILGDPHVSRRSTQGVLEAAGGAIRPWRTVGTSTAPWASRLTCCSGGCCRSSQRGVHRSASLAIWPPVYSYQAPPELLGQAYGLWQVCDALAVEDEALDGQHVQRPVHERDPLAHALRSIDPPTRLAAFFTQAGLTKSGYSISFAPLALLLTVDGQLRPLQPVISDWYAQFLETRLLLHGADAFPTWWDKGPRHGGLFLGAGLAVLGASSLEAKFMAYIDDVLKWFPDDHLPTYSYRTVPNPHDDKPLPSNNWEDGNVALDLLAGMALAWQHEKRHGATIAGFPTASRHERAT